MVTDANVSKARRGVTLSALFLAIALILSGCVSQGPPIRNYLLEDGRQYFVRPVEFRGENGTVLMDFTVRITEPEGDGEAEAGVGAEAGGEPDRSVSANFSAPLVDGSREIDAAVFSTLDGDSLPLRELRFLFVGDGTVRYESTMAYEAFARLVEEASRDDRLITFRIRRNGAVESYRPRGDFYDAMERLALRLQ